MRDPFDRAVRAIARRDSYAFRLWAPALPVSAVARSAAGGVRAGE